MSLTLSRTHTRGSDYGEIHVIGFWASGLKPRAV